jgi:hypothetical protein
MEEHLGGGCERCRRTLKLLQELEEVTGRDREYCLPAQSLRLARAVFALSDAHEPTGIFSTMMARLVFDSFASPAPAGVRALQGADRQQRRALYEVQDYCVDVSLQQVAGSPNVTLVGQVSNRQAPGQPLAGLKVELVATEGRVASTVSNPLGEFCLDYLPRQNMRLRLGVNEQSCMVVALSGLEPGASPAQPVPWKEKPTWSRRELRSNIPNHGERQP